MARLFHFTCLKHLPDILREGISKGEVPTGPEPDLTKRPNAVNLTLVGDRRLQQHWNQSNVFDKTKVRLEVEWPESGLMAFGEMVRRFCVPPAWVEIIDPWKQRDKWFFVFDTIVPTQIRQVCVFDGSRGEYTALAGEELAELIRRIVEEAQKFPRVVLPNGMVAFSIEDSTSWLLDGPGFKRMQKEKRRQERRQEAELRRERRRSARGRISTLPRRKQKRKQS